jgi:hypothetical protein
MNGRGLLAGDAREMVNDSAAAPAVPPRKTADQPVVCIEYADLCGPAPDAVDKDILRAYGPGGLGILFVRGVPGMAEAREALLPLARDVARLPEPTLAAYENERAFYCIGWSRGREKFNGKPDVAKGSFYANPIHDDPANGDEAVRMPAHPRPQARKIFLTCPSRLLATPARPSRLLCTPLLFSHRNVFPTHFLPRCSQLTLTPPGTGGPRRYPNWKVHSSGWAG